MPRIARASAGNVCYHISNRGNGLATVFHNDDDYGSFLQLLVEANGNHRMRLLGFCLMPNHFHLVAWPREDGDLSRWMQWLSTSHVRRHHRQHKTCGHVWQGRFKAFPIQPDNHLLTVLRYVERNPVRATSIPVRKATKWPWSSAGTPPKQFEPVKLFRGPAKRPDDWLDCLKQPLTTAELDTIRLSLRRGRPYGSEAWQSRTAKRLGLETTMRPRGRPRKTEK